MNCNSENWPDPSGSVVTAADAPITTDTVMQELHLLNCTGEFGATWVSAPIAHILSKTTALELRNQLDLFEKPLLA